MKSSRLLLWLAAAPLVIHACATGSVETEASGSSSGAGGAVGSTSATSAATTGTSGATTGSSGAGGQTSTSSASSSSSSVDSSSSSSSSVTSSSSGGPSGCGGCTASLTGACASGVVVVGHYAGGARTVCIDQGDNSPVNLVLMSYETTNWTLSGATGRIVQIQVYTFDPAGTIAGNAGIQTSVQVGGSVPANPYNYAPSMGDCAAHTGYAGAVFGVPQASVCDVEVGLQGACSYPSFSCLSFDP